MLKSVYICRVVGYLEERKWKTGFGKKGERQQGEGKEKGEGID